MTAESAVAVREQKSIDLIRAALDERMKDLATILPPGMDPGRFARVSLLAISKNPDLLNCTPASVIRSIVEAAEIGLEPTGSLSRAWLVPFKERDAPRPEAQLIIGYQGLADLMRDTGKVRRIWTECVYEGDHFRVVKGSTPSIEHEPAFLTEDPTKITFVYAVAEFTDGGQQAEIMTRQQIEVIRARSRARNGKAWTESWGQMARKTALRRLANYVPLSTKAIGAIERDDEREFGQPAIVEESRTAQVRERIRSRVRAPRLASGTERSSDVSVPAADPEQHQTDHSAASASPEPIEGAAREVCGDPSPFGDGSLCGLAADHEGVHRAGDDESWPRKEAAR